MSKIPDRPLFTVVTVVRNDVAGLARTRKSVAEQRGVRFEWLIADGASTDGTLTFLEGLPPAVATWSSEPDLGMYDAMNKGVARASGEYVVFMNAGDVFSSPDTLQRVARVIIGAGELPDVVFGAATFLLPNGRRRLRPARRLESYIWRGLPANHQASYFRTELLRGMKYDLRYRICGDYELAARLAQRPLRAAYMRDSLVDFRVGGVSFQEPIRLFRESGRVQREVLQLPLLVRWRAAVLRAVSILGQMTVGHRLFSVQNSALAEGETGNSR
jgi:putative colanic acid biosynthesis glycosyltransferase